MKPWDLPARQDDQYVAAETGERQRVQLISAKLAGDIHEMPEQWLRSRVRGWMELIESPDMAYWIGTYTAEGKWISCSSSSNMYLPKPFRQEFAMKVAKHCNEHAAFGGVWLAGWYKGGRDFYMVWKDPDGDLSVTYEARQPFIALSKWPLTVFERHCCTAIATAGEIRREQDIRKQDTVKVAQGERTSDHHLANSPEPL